MDVQSGESKEEEVRGESEIEEHPMYDCIHCCDKK